ncbi:hypothetical protein FRB94_010463 [Tulasnella sp. JGI-2019a]|nr:hypothetical protein FRB93_006914 [Tulasnella sp. JGI-2019a]KAG8993699.1 hypothetical protein FRB94_010463 [Tulasnella sp. JGI-2019a]KAG9021774.1 hypothetical protein FRB95_001469 [Tulasnella sp. JGI-2019a]
MDPTQIDAERSSWRGFNELKYLFIFGDSYSAVGFRPTFKNDNSEPTEEKPIGVDWPGYTWSDDQPIWVNHLINIYAEKTLLVYDYAEGGHRVLNVAMQVRKSFLRGAGRKDRDNAWTAEDSLFVTWVGINDIAGPINVDQMLDTLFELQDEIYKAGVRNFLLFNIPPLPKQKKPSAMLERVADRRTLWNDLLSQKLAIFAKTHPGSSTFLFDAHSLFTRILESPESFGFSVDLDSGADMDGSIGPDVGMSMDGVIWCDHIHPTTVTHKIIAREVAKYMTGQEEVLEREPRWMAKGEEEEEDEGMNFWKSEADPAPV